MNQSLLPRTSVAFPSQPSLDKLLTTAREPPARSTVATPAGRSQPSAPPTLYLPERESHSEPMLPHLPAAKVGPSARVRLHSAFLRAQCSLQAIPPQKPPGWRPACCQVWR